MKIETNHKKQNGKNHINVEINNMLLNNQCTIKEIIGEIKIYLETNVKRNMTYQNLWDEAKVILKGKFIAIQAYFKKKEYPK